MQSISSAGVQPGGAVTQVLRIKAPAGVGSSFSHIIIHKLTCVAECNLTTVTDSIHVNEVLVLHSSHHPNIWSLGIIGIGASRVEPLRNGGC